MFEHRLQKFALALALVVAMGLMAPSVCVADAPSGTWQHLNIGGEQWYTMQSGGQINNPAQILATLYALPNGSARFSIWTDSLLAKRAASSDPNKDAPPLGQGTKDTYQSGDSTLDRFNGALVWAGTFEQPGRFYVQVQQTGPLPTDYLLNITGTNFAFPASVQNVTAASTSREIPAPEVLPATGVLGAGSGMGMAMNPSGAKMTVKPGQPHWYVVQVPGNHGSDSHPTILAELRAQQAGAAKFTVWTPDRLHARAISNDPNKDAPPIGAGTVDKFIDGDKTISRYGGDPIWKGDGRDAATYYIVVEATGSTPAEYQMFTTYTQ